MCPDGTLNPTDVQLFVLSSYCVEVDLETIKTSIFEQLPGGKNNESMDLVQFLSILMIPHFAQFLVPQDKGLFADEHHADYDEDDHQGFVESQTRQTRMLNIIAYHWKNDANISRAPDQEDPTLEWDLPCLRALFECHDPHSNGIEDGDDMDYKNENITCKAWWIPPRL